MHPKRSILSITLILLALALPTATAAEEASEKTIVVHLGHYTDDLHAASMGMGLARLLQKKKRATVSVFLDREGVRVADARGPGDLRWGASRESVRAIYTDFVEAGGSVLLCSHCARSAGLGAEHLLPGARIANDDEIAQLFLGADQVIDY